MKLEKEISQKNKFRSEYEKLVVNILYTSGWLTAINSSRLKQYGITPQQYNVLRILKGQYPEPSTINLIIERMLDKSSNASRLVEKLRTKGLVSRATDKTDKRAVNVVIADSGIRLLEAIAKDQPKFEKMLHSLNKKDAEQLNELLDKLRG